ncbi:MAG: 2OG-Fe(II) oxygenase [Pseudomonadota bacterium]
MNTGGAAARLSARLPKVHVERDFLDRADHAALLADTLAHEAAYEPSLVTRHRDGQLKHGEMDEDKRRSRRRSLEPALRDPIKARIGEQQEAITAATGVPFPGTHAFEIEAVHNGDGAFFTRHIDTTFGATARFRVISAVYYYFAPPQRFSGGALRLYSLDQTQSVTIEPEDNMMVFFPSIFLHEVLPVHVSSQAFEAGRFSVNCWILQAA